jgi:thiopurine S-methyltransferase
MAAAEAFFTDAGLTPTREEQGGFVQLASSAIEIVVGDFFAVSPALVGTFDAFYDRASVVALPAEMREGYAGTLRGLLKPHARGLVVTFEHDARGHEPPFSVDEAEIARLFDGFDRETLGTADVLADRGGLRDRGATFAIDRCYAMRAPA